MKGSTLSFDILAKDKTNETLMLEMGAGQNNPLDGKH